MTTENSERVLGIRDERTEETVEEPPSETVEEPVNEREPPSEGTVTYLEIVATEDPADDNMEVLPEDVDSYVLSLSESTNGDVIGEATIPIPNARKSRSHSMLGRLLVENGHEKNDDLGVLVGERVKCRYSNGEWQIIDPEIEPDDRRFDGSASEKRLRWLTTGGELIVGIGMLFLLIGAICFALYATYMSIFVWDMPSLTFDRARPTYFGIPGWVYSLMVIISGMLVKRLRDRYSE